ncbi:hypothetical protein D3C72_1866200 [compost metagenome]
MPAPLHIDDVVGERHLESQTALELDLLWRSCPERDRRAANRRQVLAVTGFEQGCFIAGGKRSIEDQPFAPCIDVQQPGGDIRTGIGPDSYRRTQPREVAEDSGNVGDTRQAVPAVGFPRRAAVRVMRCVSGVLVFSAWVDLCIHCINGLE